MKFRLKHILLQVLCAISQIYTLSFLIYYTFSVLIKILREDASSGGKAIQIFEAASNAGLAATSAFSIHNSWKRRQLILEVIERTRVTCLSNKKLRIICALVNNENYLIVNIHFFQVFKYGFTLLVISGLRMFQFDCSWVWNY